MSTSRFLALGLSVITTTLGAQAPELAALTSSVERLQRSARLDSCGLAVVRDTGLLHQSLHGGLSRDEVLPIASASKWLAVAVILTLVDEELLDLDVPVGRYVREFERDDKRAVTLRSCLANTSGLPATVGDRMRGWDMAQFAAAASRLAVRDQPSTAFLYGGVGFQVAAVAAERVTGRSWHQLFAERIARPLGMTNTRFGTLLPVGGEPGSAALPWVAGGAVSTLEDYASFVRMLLDQGKAGGRQILSAASVAAMLRDQVAPAVEVRAVGFEARDVRYGLGTWLLPVAGGGLRATDPGAFGFTPWIDLDLGIGGVFAVRDRARRVLAALQPLQAEVRELVQSPVVAGTDTVVVFQHGGRERRYHLHVPARVAGEHGASLVLVLHGGGGSGEQIREHAGFVELADREGFVVAFPDGTGPLRQGLLTWNSGGIPVYAVEQRVDDVGFLRQVVNDIQRRTSIDSSRIHAVGISNGGMMCHRLARDAADLFAGIAVVAGAMNYTAAESAVPVAALLIHGTADAHVRMAGGKPGRAIGRAGDRSDASLQDAIDYYVRRNGLVAEPAVRVDGPVRIADYKPAVTGAEPQAPLRVITLDGGGHSWPGAERSARAAADAPFPFAATQAIWHFLSEVRKPERAPVPAGR